jgi:hypothetical protein
MFDWPWDIVNANPKALLRDGRSPAMQFGEINGHIGPGSYLLGEESIHIENIAGMR